MSNINTVKEKLYALESKYSRGYWHGIPQEMAGGSFHSTEVDESDRIVGTLAELEQLNKITCALRHFNLVEVGETGYEIALDS